VTAGEGQCAAGEVQSAMVAELSALLLSILDKTFKGEL